MSAALAIAERLQARRVGCGRWIAKCPAHADRAPSLTIAEGREGRTLLHCFAGCPLQAILRAAGLSMRHLFSSAPRPGPNPEPRAAATAAADRDRRRAEQSRVDLLRRQWHDLNRSAAVLARRLATTPDGAPGAEALTACFHDVLAELRLVDSTLTGGDEWHTMV
jgi:hypothetical protein